MLKHDTSRLTSGIQVLLNSTLFNTSAKQIQQHHNAQSSINALLLQHLHKMELLLGFNGWRTPGVHTGNSFMGESDEDGGAIGEADNTEHGTVDAAAVDAAAVDDAAMDDDIADTLFGLDNFLPDPVPDNL